MNNKTLAKKLSNFSFTVVSQPKENDLDVKEFKSKEKARSMQSKQRVERVKQMKTRKYNNTLASKFEEALQGKSLN